MKVLYAYAIYDKAGDIYHAPYYALNAKDAMRVFHRQLTNNPIFKDYEKDYCLYAVGQFNDVSGKLVGRNAPEFIISALAVLGRESETQHENDVDQDSGNPSGSSESREQP